MSDPCPRRFSWKRLLVDVLLVAACLGSVGFLFSHHLEQTSLGGGDNAEWRDEARDRQTWASVFDFRYHSGRHGPSAYYNPVQMIVWKVMTALFDYDREARAYYVLCLWVHLLNTLVVFLLARELLKSPVPAFCATAGFALFFPNYETVGWAAATITTGISGFFLFATLYLFIVYCRTGRKLLLALSCVAYALGLFTKEFVVFAVPFVALYYLLVARERTFRPRWRDLALLPYVLLTAPMAYIVLARLGSSAIVNEWGGFNFGIHMVHRFFDLVSYLVTARRAHEVVKLVVVGVALAALPALVWACRRSPIRAFVALWLAVALFVYSYSNFRDLYSLQRYLYQPSVPWFIMLYAVLPTKRRWLHVLLMVPIFAGTVGYSVWLILGSR